MNIFTRYLITAVFLCKGASAIICAQCNGWHGRGYKPGKVELSTCDDRNNMCETTQFCVKKIDPINPDRHYVTFKSDCWLQNSISTNGSQLSQISSGRCYPYNDGALPPKQYLYCFCNDRDYCNAANTLLFHNGFGVLLICAYLLKLLVKFNLL
uniref:Protein sleepless n=1 Tax=Acrobeloides nanus TaxID=290746 RepID=A0A914C490_9BILA